MCDSWRSFVLNQTGGFMFPMNRPCPSTPQSLTPKMMQLRFGANSPRPSPFYSPSSNSVQHFRWVMMMCISQECLICGTYSSAELKYQLYLWLGSLGHPSWVYKSLFIHLTFINFMQSLTVCVFTRLTWQNGTLPSGDAAVHTRDCCTYRQSILTDSSCWG